MNVLINEEYRSPPSPLKRGAVVRKSRQTDRLSGDRGDWDDRGDFSREGSLICFNSGAVAREVAEKIAGAAIEATEATGGISHEQTGAHRVLVGWVGPAAILFPIDSRPFVLINDSISPTWNLQP